MADKVQRMRITWRSCIQQPSESRRSYAQPSLQPSEDLPGAPGVPPGREACQSAAKVTIRRTNMNSRLLLTWSTTCPRHPRGARRAVVTLQEQGRQGSTSEEDRTKSRL